MTGIIILAAGSSSRLGKPKQNLIYKRKTLLQNAVEAAIDTKCDAVIVVLGANADIIKPTLEKYEVTIIQNDAWKEGMASSIRAGVAKINATNPHVDAVILMLCDQPFVDTALLNRIIDADTKSNERITACFYNDLPGVPALCSKHYFDELLLLKGQEGAKKLLIKYKDQIATVPFQLGALDIDTIEDYEKLRKIS